MNILKRTNFKINENAHEKPNQTHIDIHTNN